MNWLQTFFSCHGLCPCHDRFSEVEKVVSAVTYSVRKSHSVLQDELSTFLLISGPLVK